MNRFVKELRERLTIPALLLVCVFIAGTLGFKLLGWHKWTLLQCAYMTSITLTTVGYGDVLGVEAHPATTIYTMGLMLTGMGIVLYSISTITAFIVEGDITLLFKERAMQKRIDKLSGHYLVAGGGSTGRYVIKEMAAIRAPFVLIESDPLKIQEIIEEDGIPDMHYLAGDATEDHSLVKAGIKRAKGLVACLSNDKDNLYITVSAKNLNPDIQVVARAVEASMRPKLQNVGADHVVSPPMIGGLRMASEILRPNVVTFLDKMMRSGDRSTRFAEVPVARGSRVDGTSIAESGIHHETGLNVIAVLPPGADAFDYNPMGDYRITPGAVLIVLGSSDAIEKLHAMARA